MVFWAYFGSFFDLCNALTGAKLKIFKKQKKSHLGVPILHTHTKNHDIWMFCLATFTGDGRTGGRTEGQKEGRTEKWTEGRTK